MASSGLGKMLLLMIFNTLFKDTVENGNHMAMAVVAIVLLTDVLNKWQLLLPIWQLEFPAATSGELFFFKEHLKAPSLIYGHYNTTAHTTIVENFSIEGKEDRNLMRIIKEAIYTRVNNTSLNKNIGKHHLPNMSDEVLFNASELKIK